MANNTNSIMGEGKTVRYHRHSSPVIIIGQRVFPHCAALVTNVLLVLTWINWLTSPPRTLSFLDLIIVTIGFLLINVTVMAVANTNPDIAVSEDGLAIRFYFKWLFVPWGDVISVTRTIASFGRKHLVRVKGLTILHILISFSQSGSIQPGFLISPSIDGYSDLMHTIREHMGERGLYK